MDNNNLQVAGKFAKYQIFTYSSTNESKKNPYIFTNRHKTVIEISVVGQVKTSGLDMCYTVKILSIDKNSFADKGPIRGFVYLDEMSEKEVDNLLKKLETDATVYLEGGAKGLFEEMHQKFLEHNLHQSEEMVLSPLSKLLTQLESNLKGKIDKNSQETLQSIKELLANNG